MLTESQIRNIFAYLNHTYFKGELPQPNKISFRFVKKYLGMFHWKGNYSLHSHSGVCEIKFSTAYNMTDFEVEKVLIHEMIHEWQWVKGYHDHHGYSFKMKAREINALTNNKYNIARQTSLEDNTCLKDVRKGAFKGIVITYYSRRSPGERYCAVCSRRSAKRIKSWFPTHTGISNVHFYEATGKVLNTIQKSVKRVHGYPVTKEIEQTFIREI